MRSACPKARFGHGAMLLSLLLAGSVRPASAVVTAGGGYDYQGGPHGLTWSAPLAFGTVAGEEGDATLAVYRYHSSDTGWGWSGLANLGLSFGSDAGGRVVLTRAVGDQDYRAWRVQGGPTVRLREGRSLFAYVAHFEDNQEEKLTQLGAEASIPLSPAVSGLAGGALGKWQGDVSSAQGVLGLTYSGWKSFHVFGQVMFGKNIASASTLTSGGANGPFTTRGRGHSMAGGSDVGTSTSSADAAGFLGIRVFVP
jgi:hypothetical protein